MQTKRAVAIFLLAAAIVTVSLRDMALATAAITKAGYVITISSS